MPMLVLPTLPATLDVLTGPKELVAVAAELVTSVSVVGDTLIEDVVVDVANNHVLVASDVLPMLALAVAVDEAASEVAMAVVAPVVADDEAVDDVADLAVVLAVTFAESVVVSGMLVTRTVSVDVAVAEVTVIGLALGVRDAVVPTAEVPPVMVVEVAALTSLADETVDAVDVCVVELAAVLLAGECVFEDTIETVAVAEVALVSKVDTAAVVCDVSVPAVLEAVVDDVATLDVLAVVLVGFGFGKFVDVTAGPAVLGPRVVESVAPLVVVTPVLVGLTVPVAATLPVL